MALRSEEVDWVWRGTKSKNIILIYWYQRVWERNKNVFPTSKEISAVTKLVNFSFDEKAFRGEREKTFGKVSHFPWIFIEKKNNRKDEISLLKNTLVKKKRKTKKMCRKFLPLLLFFEQQSIFLILSFVVLLSRWRGKLLACFSFHFLLK